MEAAGQLRAWAQLPPRLAVLSAPFPVAEARGALRGSGVILEDFTARGNRMPPRPAWLEKDPRPALSGLLGCTALMVNDANLAALGEAWFGAGRGRRAVFHICVADGIGAGFVFDGRLFTGAHGFSGELAHVQVTPEGPACVCGNRGCLITQTAVSSRPAGPPLGRGHGRARIATWAPRSRRWSPCSTRTAWWSTPGWRKGAGRSSRESPAELERRCPPDLARTLTVVAGELADAERYGALAAADAHAAALVSETAWQMLPPAVRGSA